MKRILVALAVATLAASSAALDLSDATIADLQGAMKSGTLTAERITEAYLARIAAYDQQGPAINTVITANPKAMAEAKALDAERRAGRVRGPLHGIPIVLKDNFDTFDLPTTAGSQLLAGSIPPDDAFVVRRLRDAGVIILAKVNLSEWAGGGGSVGGATDPEIIRKGSVPNGFSSMGLQTRNPHDVRRSPRGSSSGTAAAIAAAFAQFGLGSDTAGSVRGPSAATGIVGLKPTLGLLSRDGIVPLALTLDTGGPMARSVYDVAVALGAMTGVDAADPATTASAGKFEQDYTKFLKIGALKNSRLGIARDFIGTDPENIRVFNEAVAQLTKLGAVAIDVKIPDYIIQARQSLIWLIIASEFKGQIGSYLATTKPGFPKTFDDLVSRSNDPGIGYRSPEKAFALTYTASVALDLDDPVLLAARSDGLALMKSTIIGLFKKHRLDAMVYPTSTRSAPWIRRAPANPATSMKVGASVPIAGSDAATSLASLTGFPDLAVPSGTTDEGLPATISFLGLAFSESKLLGYGYDFEQATRFRVFPKSVPLLRPDLFENIVPFAP